MHYHLTSEGPDRMAHTAEKFSRWGVYLLLAGFGMLLIDARIGIALIPVGIVCMVAGGRAVRRSRPAHAVISANRHAASWPVP